MDTLQFDQSIGTHGEAHAQAIQEFLTATASGLHPADAEWVFPIIANALAAGYAIGREDGIENGMELDADDRDATPFVHARQS